MKSRFLLPYRFKKAGAIMAPLGFVIWALLQRSNTLNDEHTIKTGLLILSFCSFMIGMFFLVLSREKTEDEYTQKVRLESYQFAAILQFAILFSLTVLVILSENRFGVFVFEQIPVLLILLFWAIYFIRFNYILYFSRSISSKGYEK